MKNKLPVIFGLILCALAFVHCTGEECAASHTIVSDLDSDCLEDSEDNCRDVYNPNQEDTDEDDIGDACEDTALFQARLFTYNLSGFYETATADCSPFASLDITQDGNTLTVTNDIGDSLPGKILGKNGFVVTSLFESETWLCQMTYNAAVASYALSCQAKNDGSTCEITGERLTTRTESP